MEDTGKKNIRAAFYINLIFSLIEFVGGIYTNSIAILSDALHDLGDALSLGVAWQLEKFSEKERDKTFTYGYGRFSLLSAFITGIILLSGSIIIIVESIQRLLQPVNPDSTGMIILSVLGIIFNLIAYLRIHKGQKLSEQMVSLHLLEDVVGWIVVLIGSLLIKFYDIPILDPIMSILVSSFILFRVFTKLKQVATIFLQGKPSNINLAELKKSLEDIQGVNSIHDLHFWSLDGTRNIMTVHFKAPQSANSEEIIHIKKQIREKMLQAGAAHVTIEVDYKEEDCSLEDC